MDIECVDQVSVEEMRFFWISWMDDVIRFGCGQQQGSDQIAEYSEPLPELAAVCLYGYMTPVTYEVRNFEGDLVIVNVMFMWWGDRFSFTPASLSFENEIDPIVLFFSKSILEMSQTY